MWPFDRQKKQRLFVQSLGKRYPKTPDMAELEQGSHVLMFLHDDLMRPHRNHRLIHKCSQKVGRGFTKDKFDYRVGKWTGRGLPFLDKEGLRVKGELHAVETAAIPGLDNHYDNGVQFTRVKVPVLITDREHRLMSIGNEEFVRKLPPGMLRTVPELGLRHYTSHLRVCIVEAHMYVALRSYWNDGDKSWVSIPPTFPRDELVWLPKYFKYPIERNRCLPPPK